MDRIEEKRSPNIAALLRASDRDALFQVMRQSQATAEALRPVFNAIDAAIYRELKAIADYISFLRSEIGELQANDMRAKRIPAAGEELNAVVSATEAAGNAIMASAKNDAATAFVGAKAVPPRLLGFMGPPGTSKTIPRYGP